MTFTTFTTAFHSFVMEHVSGFMSRIIDARNQMAFVMGAAWFDQRDRARRAHCEASTLNSLALPRSSERRRLTPTSNVRTVSSHRDAAQTVLQYLVGAWVPWESWASSMGAARPWGAREVANQPLIALDYV